MGALGAGGSSAEGAFVTAPALPGSYWVGGCTDTVSGESDTNNQCSDGVAISVTGRPDLHTINPGVSTTTIVTGGILTVSATVHNQGNAASHVTVIRYYVSTNSTITMNDTQIGTDLVVDWPPGPPQPSRGQ